MTTYLSILVSASIGACVGALFMALIIGGCAWKKRSEAGQNGDSLIEEDGSMPKTLKDFQKEQVQTLKHFLNPALFEFLEDHEDEPVEEVLKHFSLGEKNPKAPSPKKIAVAGIPTNTYRKFGLN
jgi:hypothetical protein